MDFIDLTIPIRNGTPSIPGEPGGYVLPFAKFAVQGWVSHQLLLYTHLGTHLDAPSHFIKDGGGIETWPLTQLIGPAIIARLRGEPQSGEVDYGDFDWPREPGSGDRVLLHTGWGKRWGAGGYFSGFPSLCLQLVQRLIEAGVVLVGMDTPTPHEQDPKTMHEALLGSQVAVLEGLIRLEEVPGSSGELICLPLPLVGLDGAPCRVVFRADTGERQR
ncbi:MAG TPA: cyclase family protein [bacterium]|nr:cyclase family protein [bacterium]